jgi:hypothetical protein
VLSAVAAAAAAGWIYFRRFELMRPPIGVYDAHDVVFMLTAIVALPFAYLALPRTVVGVVFCLIALNILYFGWEPVLRLPRWIWLAAVGCVAADVAANLAAGAGSRLVLVVNDLELVALAVVVANVLAQSGMRARDLALLAGALTVYDVVATTQVSLMSDLVRRLATLPFAPLVAWRDGAGWLALGLGDLLVVVLAPLVLRKAFGQAAGLVAAAASLAAVAVMLALVRWSLVRADIPAMIALGPLVVAQYAWWRTRRGRERRTWEYLTDEPADGRVTRELVEATRDRAAGRAGVGGREIGRPTPTAALRGGE